MKRIVNISLRLKKAFCIAMNYMSATFAAQFRNTAIDIG